MDAKKSTPKLSRTEKIVKASERPETPEVIKRAGQQVAKNRSMGWFASWLPRSRD